MNNVRDVYKLRFSATVLGLMILGILCFFGAELVGDDVWVWESVLENLATAFFFTGIFGLVQEFMLKDKMVDLILSKLSLKKEIDRTGIESVYFGISDVNYQFFLKKATEHIDIVHVYGRTWTNNNIDEITDRLLHSNCKIRVILLSPDSPFVPALAAHYGQAPEVLKQTMKEVSKTWKTAFEKKSQQQATRRRGRTSRASIDLYYHNSIPSNSLYRIDDRIIFVQSKMTKGKTKMLPTFVFQNNEDKESIFNDHLSEINTLIGESTKVDWNTI